MTINPIVNSTDLNEVHRASIVKILQRNENCSRADIAKLTGLTQASITKIVASLIDMGIVSEAGTIKGSGNRRAIGLRLNSERNLVIAVKFSRFMFTVGVFDISGKLYAEEETEFDVKDDPAKVLADIKSRVHAFLKRYENVVAVGIALPGPYLRHKGHIAIVSRMDAWHNVNFIKEFEEEFDKPVFLEQDANAGAMAEWWFGNHSVEMTTLAYMLVGEGVGSGIVNDGKLLLGMQGAAAETGHISIDMNGPRCECGNYGCLEMYCSTPVVLNRAKQEIPDLFKAEKKSRTDEHNLLYRSAREGNVKAKQLMEETARYIGYGCVNLINAYDPDVIVIGDVMAKAGDILLPKIREVVKERAIPELYEKVRIEMSGLEVDPTLYGAAAIATDMVLSNPSIYLNRIDKQK